MFHDFCQDTVSRQCDEGTFGLKPCSREAANSVHHFWEANNMGIVLEREDQIKLNLTAVMTASRSSRNQRTLHG